MSEKFICPITNCIFLNPVVASDNITYEKTAIENWLKTNDNSPIKINEKMNKTILFENTIVKELIGRFNKKASFFRRKDGK
jgi:hypothetical protein